MLTKLLSRAIRLHKLPKRSFTFKQLYDDVNETEYPALNKTE